MKHRNNLNCIGLNDKIGRVRKATNQYTPRFPIHRRIDIRMIEYSIQRRIEL